MPGLRIHKRVNLQRLILGSLIILWGAVLPFLCWGAWSDPNHPHASPHFVFAKPPLYETTHHHDDTSLAGVAHPDTLLITLLALFVPAGGNFLRPREHRYVKSLSRLQTRTYFIVVPTPPPRLSLS